MKQKRVRFFFYLFSFFVLNTIGRGQAPSEAFTKLATIPLQSPQAASISKYVEFPVSYYTGLTPISLPVYEVKSGDISVSISLSYHGGGIKVQEEASWVGLGWTLNAGGVITHDIKGRDDEVGTNHQFNKVYPNGTSNTYLEGSYTKGVMGINYTPVYNEFGAPYDPLNLYNLLSNGTADTEPDMYVYSLGSYSGKFFSGEGQYVDLSRNNIQFQNSGAGFLAQTPDGYTYTFECVEKSWSYPTPNATNTAYYLTKIKSPRGKIVSFQYKSFKTLINEHETDLVKWSTQYANLNYAWGNDETVVQLPALTENYLNYQIYAMTSNAVSPGTEAPGLHQSYSSTTSSNFYLDKIYFDNGFIDFVKSPRNDLYGVKLDEVRVYRSNGTLVKSVPFSYNYFVSNTGDDDLYDRTNKVKYLGTYDSRVDYYPANYRNTRLKLLNVNIEAVPHSFEYQEGDQYNTLPFKTSFKQDFWGYYNGRINYTLVPDYDLYKQQMSLPTALSGFHGANRNPDNNYIRAGLVRRINYPTGGYSDFNYEMNQFDNLTSQQKTVYREVKHGGIDAGVGLQKFYFTITEETHCNIFGGLYCNGMQDMNSPSYNCGCNPRCGGSVEDGLYAYVEKVHPNTRATIAHYLNWEFDISKQEIKNAGGYISLPNETFAPGTYCITVNYPDNHTPTGDITNNRRAELYVSFYEPVPGIVNTTSIGAGLRISSITHFDPVTTQTLKRNFTYAGGKMMRYPVFCSRTLMHYTDQYLTPWGDIIYFFTDYLFYYLYATPSIPYSFSANGSPGGYDAVTETISGPSSIGKTVYEYKNRVDPMNSDYATYLPGVPTTGYLDNGFLKRVGVYDKNNSLLKETLNESVVGVARTYWPFKGRYATIDMDQSTFASSYQFSFYPVQVGKLLTSQTIEKNYVNGTSISIVKDFSYNNNGLLNWENLTSSEGRGGVTNTYTYASDYTSVNSGWIKGLKDKNFIGAPLEVLSKRRNLVTGGSYTTYSVNGDLITPSQIYKIETASPQNIASTAPNGNIPQEFKTAGTIEYDANGNIKQTRSDNNIYTSFVWGYNNSLPVAKVINAQQKDVFYTSFEDVDGNSTIGDSKTGKKSRTGSYSKTLSNLTNSNYTLSYWLKSLGDWILQTNVVAVNNNNYTISIAGQIDDVRFYPQNAQLTSYTYDPLVGITSESDINNRVTFFEYDNISRLLHVRDNDNHLLKKYDYVYNAVLPNAPSWTTTGNTRCKPCPQSSAYVINIKQIEVKDTNPLSATYGQSQWRDNGISTECSNTLPENWQATGNYRCIKNSSNQNTGGQEREERNVESCTANYGTTRWVYSGSNTSSCAIPVPCDQNCATGPSKRCVNGICETGQYVVLSKQQQYSNGSPVCIVYMGYIFSDGSTQVSGTETKEGYCD
ncbi:MAG: repeat protein [Segetibacter sp.]|nr:repeat protein [Segetibacter sp.]